MKAIPSFASTVLSIGLLTTLLSPTAAAEPQVALTVRLYNTSGISAPAMLEARRAAEFIFREAGLDVIFRQCGRAFPAGTAIDPCSESLKPLEVVVRVIEAPAFSPDLHPEAFGVAYVLKETDRGWLTTVFSDRIADAAGRVGIDAGALLGFVMAHEVGHVLLGVGYHGETGVMRADWPDALINRTSEHWTFSSVEAAKIRQAAFVRF